MRARPISAAPPPERRLAAILAADVDGHSHHMRDDDTHRGVSAAMEPLRLAILEASGTIFSFAGKRLMAEFASATEALKCALRIQANAAQRTTDSAEPIRFRVALNAGEILVGKRHIGGAAINLAARLERIAPPGGIVLPRTLHDQLRHAVPVPASPMGQPELHDFTEPLVVVAISTEACRAWAGDKAGRKPAPPRSAPEPRASLAVVPFRAADRREVLAGGAIDDIIRGLGGMATWLAVIRAPAATIHTPIDLQRIRQITGARYVLHGVAEAERDRVRLTVELNEAETGRVLWSDRFDDMAGQQAALRQDAASYIARAIPPLLLRRELDRSTLAPRDALSAHDLALRAFAAIMQPERHSFAAAAEMLRQAERRPPPHDSARFATVWWHLMAISQGWSADPAADARTAATAAARMHHTDPAAAALLAFMHSVLHRDHRLASAMLDRVIDSAPLCSLAGSLKALTQGWIGEAQSAIFHAEQAETMPALGPERAWREHVLALAYYLGGQYNEAARWARVSAVHHPGLAANARLLAASLAVLGQLDEAQQAAQRVLAIDPNFRIEAWRQRSMLPEESRTILAQRLRLAGLPA